MEESLAYLRRAHDQGLLVPFVGAGLSAAAAGLPSWPDLLEAGLRYVVADCGVDPADPRIARAQNTAANGKLIDSFDLLQDLLSMSNLRTSIKYEAFLAEVFAEPNTTSTELLSALHFLQPRRVVTTNYDTLLENFGVCKGSSVTWQQPAAIRDVFRLGEGVVHLHGTWNLPSSVILSRRNYESIASDMSAKQVAQVIFHSGVLLFVGTSLDGTNDPHVGDLLSEFERLADPIRGEQAPHVMLLRGTIRGDIRARLNRQGIRAVSYGADHGDLPRYLHNVGETGQVQISTRPVDHLIAGVAKAPSLDDALRAVGAWITSEVFPSRTVRVAFSTKQPSDSGFLLRRRAVIPANSSGNPHNYPLSISAWSLLEGRPISWPNDRGRLVDFAWLRRLRKLDAITAQIMSSEMDRIPELSSYTDLATIRRKFTDEELALGDFFQDWASDQPELPYAQFLSIPVPWLEGAPTREDLPEYGVFNIDTREKPPLLDRRVNELLKLASSVTAMAFRLFELRGPEAVGTIKPIEIAGSDAQEPAARTKQPHWTKAMRWRRR
jgi:hypothetical protein